MQDFPPFLRNIISQTRVGEDTNEDVQLILVSDNFRLLIPAFLSVIGYNLGKLENANQTAVSTLKTEYGRT